MARKTIPDLKAAVSVAGGDLFEIADISNGNASRKATKDQILTGIPTSALDAWTGEYLVAPFIDSGGAYVNALSVEAIRTGVEEATDVFTPLQALIVANPGRVIYLPCGNYHLSERLVISGEGTALIGEVMGYLTANYGTVLIMDTPGEPVVVIAEGVQNGGVCNLTIEGCEPWAENLRSQAVLPTGVFADVAGYEDINGSEQDGIRIRTSWARVHNVMIRYCGRDGIRIQTGTVGLISDTCNISNVKVQGNRGNGYFCEPGNDSSTNKFSGCVANVVMMWGFLDRSFLGNTYEACFAAECQNLNPANSDNDTSHPANQLLAGDSRATTTLTSDNTNVANNSTVTIGGKTYTNKTALTPTEGEVLIGGSADGSLLNIIRAINHTGTPGVDYSCAAANTQVSASPTVILHSFVLTALDRGTAGNAIAVSASSSPASHISFTAATLTGGTDVAIPAGNISWTRVSNLVTLTITDWAYLMHGAYPLQAGHGVVVSGTSQIDGTHLLVSATQGASTTTVTFNAPGSNVASPQTTGKIRVANPEETITKAKALLLADGQITATENIGGDFHRTVAIGSTVIVNPYAESNKPLQLSSNTIVLGFAGGADPDIDFDYGYPMVLWGNGSDGHITSPTTNVWSEKHRADTGVLSFCLYGVTADQLHLRYRTSVDGSFIWRKDDAPAYNYFWKGNPGTDPSGAKLLSAFNFTGPAAGRTGLNSFGTEAVEINMQSLGVSGGEPGTGGLKIGVGNSTGSVRWWLRGDATLPADGSLSAGMCAVAYDPTNGASKVLFKAKSLDGTVVTGNIALA